MVRGTTRLGIERAEHGLTRVLGARVVYFVLLLLAVIVTMLAVAGCSGASASRPVKSTPGTKSPCKLDAGAKAPAQEFLEIQTCPVPESERAEGDSR